MSQFNFFEYKQGFPPYHAMNRENTRRKMFLLLVRLLTMLILIGFLPSIQESCYWIKSAGVRVSAAEFDIDDGVSLSVP